MVHLEQKRIWSVIFITGGNYPPKEFIHENLTTVESQSIYDFLRVLEKIKYPREFPRTKHYSHNGTPLYQVTVGNFRIYIHVDSSNKRLVVSYICRKSGNKAKKQDKDRAVAAIQDYIVENREDRDGQEI